MCGRTFMEDMLLECVSANDQVVSGIKLEIPYQCYSHISWECSEQYIDLSVLYHGSVVAHNAEDVVISKNKGSQADIPTFALVHG